ncbi:TPA: hypothetical protein QDZ34_001090 [Stenotrophomonas maltophilia]|nr:hypothetical protein [Stenotrophomonas maltophilia]HDS1025460.1 hypothetical protein [Stenotrophomonas maltophilia]HDS1029133.1 hypothetical protein [Stenotrophomonas maltophilia]HDS1033765.1 hypothetical protein [Stenotrophomonas maltophilia]
MEAKAIETKYGLIYGRDALTLSETELTLYPLSFVIRASLSLRSCKPMITDAPDVDVEFLFGSIKSISIYKTDDYPYEKRSLSSLDLIGDMDEDGLQHVVLSTYDHVFDVIGEYEIKYAKVD